MSPFLCGPLRITVKTEDSRLADKIADTLSLFDIDWSPPHRPVELTAEKLSARKPSAQGNFLVLSRMSVDSTDKGLHATTTSGAHGSGQLAADHERWLFQVPDQLIEAQKLEEIEDLLSLALTTGWRREGWVPLHAAGLTIGDRSIILCAPSGGGKSTLTAALIRRGWRALGDDKLLLKLEDGGEPLVAALLHTFNLHPRTREWLPEVGDLEQRPVYSALTPKRKVPVAEIWPDRTDARARPSDLVWLIRRDDFSGMEVTTLEPNEVLSCLLRQTVIPNEPGTASQIVSTIVSTASKLKGVRLEVGRDAYRDLDILSALELALQ